MTDLKKSPLHDRHEALGAKFAEFGGWSMPLQYAGIVGEHRAVREAVGIFDVSHLGKARITGPGAAEFLNTAITNDVHKIGVGQAQYTLLCNDQGGVIDDLIWYWLADEELFLIPNAANTAEVVERLAAAAPGLAFVDSGDGIARRIAHLLAGQDFAAGPTGNVALFTAPTTIAPAFREALAHHDLHDIRTL